MAAPFPPPESTPGTGPGWTLPVPLTTLPERAAVLRVSPRDTMARVELQHVDKVFDGYVKVVSDFSLTIEDREFIVLVGPSGCGKSTTLRMIAGLEDVTSGTISIDGQIVNQVAPRDRDIAMVFQSYALYPHMSVRDNLAFGLKMRRVDAATIQRKVHHAAEVLGITALLDRLPKQLSGGQRQRVAVGRAIVREPKCFLFDEPLSNLDAKLRVEMRAELKRLHLDLASTTVYVTHDQEEAMTLGDRVVVMRDGIIQQCDQALTVYRRPTNRFVAEFLGNPPMNVVPGDLSAEGNDRYFQSEGLRLRLPDWVSTALGERTTGRVVLGLRPEALCDVEHARFPVGDNRIETKVILVQPLGSRMDVHVSLAGTATWVAQLDAFSGLATGQTLSLAVDPKQVHLFEGDGEGRSLLWHPPVETG